MDDRYNIGSSLSGAGLCTRNNVPSIQSEGDGSSLNERWFVKVAGYGFQHPSVQSKRRKRRSIFSRIFDNDIAALIRLSLAPFVHLDSCRREGPGIVRKLCMGASDWLNLLQSGDLTLNPAFKYL